MRNDTVTWYRDTAAEAKGEPGLAHSYPAALATTLRLMRGDVDPVELMGASAFAFRIFVNEVFCPSAMSMFSFADLLPEAVAQAGLHGRHIGRFWDEDELEEERRAEAHAAILEAIARGVPAVVWDVAEAEWGLILDLDEGAGAYRTLTCRSEHGSLPFTRLGRNGIDILSVVIPGGSNDRDPDTIRRNALGAAVVHAAGGEWIDRPQYQNGLPAYALWAGLFDKWALLAEAGRNETLAPQVPECAGYYARINGGARCYARDWLGAIAGSDEHLGGAAEVYGHVAASLRPLWETFPAEFDPDADLLRGLAEKIREAGRLEEQGIGHLQAYLE